MSETEMPQSSIRSGKRGKGTTMGIPLQHQFVLSDEGKQALGQIVRVQGKPPTDADLDRMARDWDFLNDLSDSIIEDDSAGADPRRAFVVSFLTDTYRFFGVSDAQRAGGAACQLGALHYVGALNEERTPEYDQAFKWYEKGADLGNVQALINLGYCYQYGRSVEKDMQKAYDCFHRAALVSTSPEAYYKLGDMYRWGDGVKQDKGLAMALYEKALAAMRSQDEDCDTSMPEVAGSVYHRIADMRMDRLNPPELDGDADAKEGLTERLNILGLYQEAERCYRRAIFNGYAYYEKNLDDVVAKQDEMREILKDW
jgi:tetratricopeptide (TPR) repeat protein